MKRTTEHTIVKRAEDKRDGMTLGDLATFCEQAAAAGVDPDTFIKVTVGFRQQLQAVEISTGDVS